MRKPLRIAIVSPYPPPGLRHVYGSGVAAYTKNLAEALKQADKDVEVHVVANNVHNLPKLYRENGVIIHRVFKQDIFYVFHICRELCKIKPDVVHIQHEYFLYGNIISAMLFPLLVALSRMMCGRVIVTLHGVIPLYILGDEKFLKENGIRGSRLALKLGMLLVTKLIVLFSSKVVVHEDVLKQYLEKYYKVSSDKIEVIPHGVEHRESIDSREAKRKLGINEEDIVLLYFGYLVGYKGIDELLNAYKEVVTRYPNTVLVIAGGPHPRLYREKWYKKWLIDVTRRAMAINSDMNGRVMLTGYVPEDKIVTYFSAADLVVLPYRVKISSSGPEAIAISLGKPYLLTVDINDPKKIANLILSSLEKSDVLRKKVREVGKRRYWNRVAEKHLLLYNQLLSHEK